MSTETCVICGKPSDQHKYYSKSAEAGVMLEHKLCFSCAFWELRARAGCKTVIDGAVYSPGPRTAGAMLGMAGRRFDIEYIADGRRITTFDLWYGGVIPVAFRERIPDTARFINQARRATVGDSVCWDASDPKAERFPAPTRELYE